MSDKKLPPLDTVEEIIKAADDIYLNKTLVEFYECLKSLCKRHGVINNLDLTSFGAPKLQTKGLP